MQTYCHLILHLPRPMYVASPSFSLFDQTSSSPITVRLHSTVCNRFRDHTARIPGTTVCARSYIHDLRTVCTQSGKRLQKYASAPRRTTQRSGTGVTAHGDRRGHSVTVVSTLRDRHAADTNEAGRGFPTRLTNPLIMARRRVWHVRHVN